MSPFTVVVIIAGVACAFAWTASLVTGDTSWVDRLWSIVPGDLRVGLSRSPRTSAQRPTRRHGQSW